MGKGLLRGLNQVFLSATLGILVTLDHFSHFSAMTITVEPFFGSPTGGSGLIRELRGFASIGILEQWNDGIMGFGKMGD